MRAWQMGLIASVALLTVGVFTWRQATSVSAIDLDKPHTLSIDEQRASALAKMARKMLDDELADYPSARFKDVHALHYLFGTANGHAIATSGPAHNSTAQSDIESYVLCGSVNPKNRVGGYTGWTPFAVEADAVHLASPDAPNEAAVIASLCEGRGDGAEQAIRQLKAGETIISVARRYQQNLDPLNPPEDDPKIARIVQDDQNLEGKLKTNWFATIPHHWDWARDYAKEIAWHP